jgi:hypothetical protein
LEIIKLQKQSIKNNQMNIVELIKGDINPDLLNSLAAANGETIEKTSLTIETSLTSLLLAFMKRASTETGLHLLHSLTNNSNFSANNLVDSIFPNDKLNNLADEGNSLISKIIPDKKSPLITFVSSYSGVRNASANRTNGIVTLLILNKLKQVSASKTLDLGGLAELFADQKDYLIESAPSNLIEKLSQHIGLGNLISLGSSIITTSASLNTKNERDKQKKEAENAAKYSSNDGQNSEGGFKMKNWIIPGIFGALVLGAMGYYAYTEYYTPETSVEPVTKDTLININDTLKIDSLKPVAPDTNIVKTNADTLLIEMEEQTLPDGQKVTFEKGNFPADMLSFLRDTTKTNTKKLVSTSPTFEGSELNASASETFTNIGKIMKAFPQSRLKISVNDYIGTDSTNTGKSANKKAFALKKILLNNGILPIRVDAVGVIKRSQGTESLKAKEVELVVMKK